MEEVKEVMSASSQLELERSLPRSSTASVMVRLVLNVSLFRALNESTPTYLKRSSWHAERKSPKLLLRPVTISTPARDNQVGSVV